MTHTFFLIMGGFVLHDKKGTTLRILESSELETLSETGKITWPSITKEEIQDRSQTDYLSKGILIMHLGWFITQYTARWAYGLGVTRLESLTLSFAAFTGVTYYLWWHKPLDVPCSLAVPVYLLENESVSESILSSAPGTNPVSDLAHPGTYSEPTEGLELTQIHIVSQCPIDEESQLPQQPLIVSELDPDPGPQGPDPSNAIALQSRDNFTATSYLNLFAFQLRQFVASVQKNRGILKFGPISDALLSHKLDHSESLCVPTFYSPMVDDTIWHGFVAFILTWLASFFFLSVASFSGPDGDIQTPNKSLAWSCLVVIWMMSIQSFFTLINYPKVIYAISAIYTLDRIAFFIVAFIELRALPLSELVGISWTSILPHFGLS